ncbi:MAG: indolepyruvate oxidoreductase subunit beta [Pseudomonadota bacterium]
MKDVVRLIIVAVGGQGNLLAARVLGEAALAQGVDVHMSEIHGMAQRGGVVESAVVFGKADSSIISDSEADVLLGFEPGETLRALARAKPGALVITSTSPLPPFTAAIGKGVYPEPAQVLELIRQKVGRVVAVDARALANQAGSPLAQNMVLLGALARTESVPVGRDAMRKAIETGTKAAFLEMNLKAFDLGYEAAGGQ